MLALLVFALRPNRLRVYILKNIYLDKHPYKNIFSKFFFPKNEKNLPIMVKEKT